MKKLYVYADFDWLKEVELIGELCYESLRGADSYSFTFNNEWLRQHSDLFLSDDLNNYPGQQYTQPDKDIFGCFSDALPDRWGRTLLLRREQIAAAEEKRPVRRLSSFDFLTGIDDFSRMGGFRFKEDLDGEFINVSESLKIPPLTDIRELIAASAEIEKCEENNMLPDRKWIAQLVQPGTSLGGARPKANVIDTDKTLYVAKFPSRKDDYDTGLWEHFSHLLAIKAGINAATTKVLTTGEKYHTLSPAYDMNPTLNEYQSLLISSTTNKSDLSILFDTCEDYMINFKTAEKIISEVIEAVKGWRELATRLGISKREMDMFAGVLDGRYKAE